LPEGYVYAIKDDSGIHLPSDPKEFGTYLEVEERGGNTYFRKKGDVEVPEILPEIKSIIRMEKDSLQMGAVYKCVYEQMALLGAFPFSYYLVLGGQILTIAIEMAVPTLNEKGIIEYCMGCETAKNWQEVLLKNKPFEKIQTGINSIEVRECHAGGICYADLLQLYRENVGHVKEKLKIFEKQDNLAIERIDYVETALQYYFLESLFQLASLLIEPVEISIKDKYRKKISKKLEEYKEKINKIYERVRFSTEASNEEELFIIKPSEMKGFALNLSELLDLLNNLLKTENTENIRELENYFYNFQVYKMFWKCYNLLIRTIMSLLEKISSLPKESIKLTMFLPKSSPDVSSPEVTEDEIKDALPNAETYLTRILEKNGIIKFRVRKDEKDNVVKDRILYEIARQIVIFRKVKRRNPELNEINLSKCIREIIKNSPKRLNYLK
jgi:hypothetical protein